MPSTSTAGALIRLLGCFELITHAGAVRLPLQAQRVVAYLVVGGVAVDRHQLAERLWPFAKTRRAQSNLRTALWRIRRDAPGVVQADRHIVALCNPVCVDYCELLDGAMWPTLDDSPLGPAADAVQNPTANPDANPNARARAETPSALIPDLIARLRSDLLPGWDEEWLVIERERVRQMRVRRLETISRRCCEAGAMEDAISAAYSAIWIEPLRESAHLALISAHVADGNRAEAVHQLGRTTASLRSEIGIDPSAVFWEKIRALDLPVPAQAVPPARTAVG